jgi:uncharacterized protein YigA (DUF484 family)
MQSDAIENNAISTESVTQFLRDHPHFFEQNAHLLTEIYLPSPHGSGAISLAERQQLAQRDKVRLLEAKLAQLIELAEENEATSTKVHQLAVMLLLQQKFIDLQQALSDSMQQDFGVTESTLILWGEPTDESLKLHPSFKAVNDDFIAWVKTLSKPYTGPKPIEAGNIVPDHLQSFAFIPLHQVDESKASIGVLILASEVPHKFQVGMGTVHLERIAALVSAALLNRI